MCGGVVVTHMPLPKTSVMAALSWTHSGIALALHTEVRVRSAVSDLATGVWAFAVCARVIDRRDCQLDPLAAQAVLG